MALRCIRNGVVRRVLRRTKGRGHDGEDLPRFLFSWATSTVPDGDRISLDGSRASAEMGRCVAVVIVSFGVLGCAIARQVSDVRVIVPFTPAHGLVFIELDSAGHGALLALLDTGANASAIDPRRAAKLPIIEASTVEGTTGNLKVDVVMVEGLRVGKHRFPPLRATRRDLSGLLAPPGRSVDMILGSDAVSNRAVTIDFPASRIELAARPPPDSSQGVPMILDAGIPAIEGCIGGMDIWLRIDTGASFFETPDVYINLPKRTWEGLRGAHAGIATSTHLKGTGANGVSVDLPVARIPIASVGPLELDYVFVIAQPERGYFANPDAKGFVSNNFLRQIGRVTLDYVNGRLRRSN